MTSNQIEQGPTPLLQVSALSKRFLGTQALDGVDFDVEPGEVHALLGQNGAGKSTLIKILAGVYAADAGEVRLRGRVVRPGSESLPIAFIHQDLGLVAGMTVAENVALMAGFPGRGPLISWRRTRGEAQRALAALDIDIAADRTIAELSPPERSLVAIARSLAHAADVVVLDEPTASLPERDVARLFSALDQLRSRGVGLVYVSHRIDEVFRLADRVTVLRDGRRVATGAVSDTKPDELVRLIVGRGLASVTATNHVRDEHLLDVEELTAADVGPVSFAVRAGEVLGLVGLRGAGHDTVGRVVAGALPALAGVIKIAGAPVRARNSGAAIASGVGFVPGDRNGEGVAAQLSVQENLYPNQVVRGGSVLALRSRRRERRETQRVLDEFDVRPRDPDRPIGSLSGGNQQKAVVARWLEADRPVLVLEDPTAGVDVGAKADIYRLLDRHTGAGGAALVVSADFEEVARICGRALVFGRGRVVAELHRPDITVTALTAWTSGSFDAATSGRTA